MPNAPTDILIFGAGFGTRMRPLTDDRPKPLIEVGGRALVDHALDVAQGAGLSVHVNAHYRADQLAKHLPPSVQCHIESPDILDTGGGLKAAMPHMQGAALATLNSDVVWQGPNPISLLLDQWTDEKQALLLLVPIEQTVGYSGRGNFSMSPDGRLHWDWDGALYAGAHIIRRDAIEATPGTTFSLRGVWGRLIAQGTAFGAIYPGRWADVGTPEGIPLAEALLNDV